jgi:hypothetical protein
MKLESRFNSSRVTVFLAGVVVVVLAVAILVVRDAERAAANLAKPHDAIVDLALVVNQIRGLNRLETAAMRVTHVATISQTYTLIPDALAGDEVTLYAVGDVIAGVDLSQLQPGDIQRDANGTVIIHLPPSMVLLTRLDNRQTHVVNRRTGVFRRADQQLEARARQYAEQSIRSESVRRGILQTAELNAQARVAELARALGARKVVFEGWKDERSKG